MMKYIKVITREFLGLDTDYEYLLSNQDHILDQLKQLKKLEIQNQDHILDQLKQLEKLEIQNQELILEEKKESYYDYLTLKNALWVLFFLGFLGGGFWLYNTDFFNNSILESIKSLGTLSKELHTIDQKGVLDALKKLNENSMNLSKEEIKLLLEIKNLLLKKGIDDNQSPALDTPINELSGTVGWGDFRD